MSDAVEPAGTAGLHAGAMVDHFRVVRSIGQGGMGEVYLARDLRLGRKVAIKVIRPAALGGRAAVDRFLSEARSTARFNHPNIVTIYAVGEIEGRPYVALEFVDGQTLAARLRDGPLALMEAVRLGLAVAEAVAEAHANAVVHRDLKPENVIIGRDGRPRVLDFGLARVIGEESREEADRPTLPAGVPGGAPAGLEYDPALTRTAPGDVESALCGTPLYMSPEQWRGLPASKASDLWALGLMLYEMLEGRHPWSDHRIYQISAAVLGPAPVEPLKTPLPRALADLVARCLAKTPESRPSAAELCEELRGLLHSGRRVDELERGPFRGLLSFDDRHADLFFGREAETDAFLERLRDEPVIAVVAHSGAGKSSFVQAGVIPRLRELHRTVVLRLRPGAEPMRTLAARIASGESTPSPLIGGTLTPASGPSARQHAEPPPVSGAPSPDALEADLRASPERAAVHLSDLAERQNALVLLFVDQLEEVFTQGASAEEARLFLQALASAADDRAGSVRVCFTLRDDFVGKVADAGAARQLLAGLFVLQTPTGDRLRDILQRAVSAVGYAWESQELLQEMTEAVRGESAALPLLQFAGQMMWERRDRTSRLLTRAAYEQVGGVAGALARHADAVLLGMSPTQTSLARTLLLRLVTPQNTRRVLDRPGLLAGIAPQAGEVLQMLVDGRLVIARGRAGTPEGGQVEIAHEALIAVWGRLARWLEEARDELGVLLQAEQAAELWDRRGRRADEVWQGDALADALRRASRTSRELPPIVRDFLAAGRSRELRTQRRRRGALATAVSVLAGVAVVLALQNQVAQKRRVEAEEASEVAQARRAEALYEGARAALDRLDPLEARARLRSSLELRDLRLARPLWWRLKRTAMRWNANVTSATNTVALSPEGRAVAIGGNDGTVFSVDPMDRSQQVLRGIQGQISAIGFSGDMSLAVRTWGGQISEWDLEAHHLRVLLEPGPSSSEFLPHPSGRWIASLHDDGTVQLIDARQGTALRSWRAFDEPISTAESDPSGERLAVGTVSGKIRVFDTRTSSLIVSVAGHEGRVKKLHLAGSDLLLSAGADGTVRSFELRSGRQIRSFPLGTSGVSSVAFNPAGTLLAHGTRDHALRLIDTASGQEQRVLRGHTDEPYRIAFDSTGRSLVSSSTAKDVIYWDLDRKPEIPAEARGHSAEVHGLAVSPDGKTIVTGGTDHSIRWWDADSGALRRVSRGPAARVNGVAFRPDGAQIASASMDGTLRLWDAASGAPIRSFESTSPPMSVAWSRDGRTIASAHLAGTVRLWDAATGRPVAESTLPGVRLWHVALHSDGRTMAVAAADGSVRILDARTARELRSLTGHQGEVWSVSWGAGNNLYSTGEDGKVILWDGALGPGRLLYTHSGRGAGVAIHPDGSRIAATGAAGQAAIVEPRTGHSVVLRGHRARDVNTALFLPDGDRVATAGDDGTVRLWRVEDGLPMWRAPVLFPLRPALLTHRGWTDPSGGAGDVRPTGAWVAAVEKGCRLADFTPDASRLCFTPDLQTVGLWSSSLDQVQSAAIGGLVAAVVATASGCTVRTGDGRAVQVRAGAGLVPLAEQADAIARSERGVLIAGGREVREVDSEGKATRLIGTDIGVTAVAELGTRIAVGYREGGLEVAERDGSARRTAFEQVPTSAVERIVAGPMGTLIAGYATGDVGIWDTQSGSLLMRFVLHGPAVHLLMDGKRLIAASELGDYTVAELGEYALDYCSLLREVWANVPVVWEGGQVVKRPPPRDHRCSASP